MTEIKALLQTVYQDDAKKVVVPPSNEAAFKACKTYAFFAIENLDQYMFIQREVNWTERYNNRSRGKKSHYEVYFQDIMRYINGCLDTFILK